jgi:uncharacterized protein
VTNIIDILRAVWGMIYEAGFYVIFGMVAAGLVHLFISRQWVVRHLGGRGFGSVIKAALLGAPLPLCSCSVLPAACALRSKGAGRGATVSFLISTPETGVDSIAITWALLGPVMALARPIAAVATAMAAGFIETVRDRHEPQPIIAGPACTICNSDDCEHVHRPSRWSRFWSFMLYDMGDDLGPSLALGLVLGGIVWAVVPTDFFVNQIHSPWQQMLLMLAVGLPLYICATASTPLALALVAKGLSPGAALVLLLVGPATNITTMLVVGRMLGKLSAVLYVATIAVMSLVCGAVLDLVVSPLDIKRLSRAAGEELLPPWLLWAGAVTLAAFLAMSLGRWVYRKWPRGRRRTACCAGGACGTCPAEHDREEATACGCACDDHDHA